MSEEQTTFKVTDRRLFNADGTPRDLQPEEKLEANKETATLEAALPAQAQTTVSSEPRREEVPPASYEEDVNDPASFVNFLMSIASNAASSLGMMEHPTNQRQVDLELGKHWIEVLGMLEKKTRGNLTTQEHQMFESLLAELRMQYVSLTSATPKKQTLTGSDITGGR
ncbi:MAG: DUF1844 domain-containing protein [Pyrinomonadaceae bacterium]